MNYKIGDFITLMRPHQYIKNLFVLTPLFFIGKINDQELLLSAVIAVIAFSITASAIYILNDYRDIEEDRLHPKKKMRPLASGAIKPIHGLVLMVILAVLGLGGLTFFSQDAALVLAGYVILNIGYTFKLKHIAILDVTIVATGFVLRLFVGSIVVNVPLSQWIVITTFLLALFLALAKRRDDVMIFEKTGQKMRKVIAGYNLPFVNAAMMITAAVVVVSYIQYTTSPQVISRLGDNHLYLTVIFVNLGIMRYLQIAMVEENSGSPTKIMLKDRFMQIVVLGWLAAFVWILY